MLPPHDQGVESPGNNPDTANTTHGSGNNHNIVYNRGFPQWVGTVLFALFIIVGNLLLLGAVVWVALRLFRWVTGL